MESEEDPEAQSESIDDLLKESRIPAEVAKDLPTTIFVRSAGESAWRLI